MKPNYKKLAEKYRKKYKKASDELKGYKEMGKVSMAAIGRYAEAEIALNAKTVAYDMLQARYDILLREYAELQEARCQFDPLWESQRSTNYTAEPRRRGQG